jgi:hypothetical protein
VPTIFLYHRTNAMLVKPFVTGYVTTAVDFWPGQQTLLIIDVERPTQCVIAAVTLFAIARLVECRGQREPDGPDPTASDRDETKSAMTTPTLTIR